jgi:hypothetical protein
MTHLYSPTRFTTAGVNRVFIDRKSGDCCDKDYGKILGLLNVPGEAFPRFNFQGGLVPVDAIGAGKCVSHRVHHQLGLYLKLHRHPRQAHVEVWRHL